MPPPPTAHRVGVDGMGVPLLPKLRGHFAEFLNHSSLVRLGVLYLTTCVGLGYGPCVSSLEAFLGSIGSPNSPHPVMHHLSGIDDTRICLGVSLQVCPSITTDWYGYLPASPHRLPTTSEGPTQPVNASPRKVKSLTLWVVSTTDSVWDGHTRVREYQPVVHRLRLSASP